MRTRTLFTILICSVAIILSRASASAEEHEFRYKAPDAKSVELMCENNGWKSVPMTKSDDGVWTTKVSLSPGTYAYKFLVNGTDWVFDPDNSNKKSVEGVENSSVEIK
ncbi:MAG: glycogen-binding domain-containing protein [Chthoniobacterales bacterium]